MKFVTSRDYRPPADYTEFKVYLKIGFGLATCRRRAKIDEIAVEQHIRIGVEQAPSGPVYGVNYSAPTIPAAH